MRNVEWDEGKRRENIRDRGVDFLRASLIFDRETIEAEDTRQDYGERRYRALGQVDDECFVVVYTWRGRNRRIISAWKLGEDGRRRYQAILAR
jgi:uncharacterized protein